MFLSNLMFYNSPTSKSVENIYFILITDRITKKVVNLSILPLPICTMMLSDLHESETKKRKAMWDSFQSHMSIFLQLYRNQIAIKVCNTPESEPTRCASVLAQHLFEGA